MKTEFMLRLEQKLGQSLDAAETLRILTVLNDGKPFRSLTFLKKAEPKVEALAEPLRSRILAKLSALNQTESPCPPE